MLIRIREVPEKLKYPGARRMAEILLSPFSSPLSTHSIRQTFDTNSHKRNRNLNKCLTSQWSSPCCSPCPSPYSLWLSALIPSVPPRWWRDPAVSSRLRTCQSSSRLVLSAVALVIASVRCACDVCPPLHAVRTISVKPCSAASASMGEGSAGRSSCRAVQTKIETVYCAIQNVALVTRVLVRYAGSGVRAGTRIMERLASRTFSVGTSRRHMAEEWVVRPIRDVVPESRRAGCCATPSARVDIRGWDRCVGLGAILGWRTLDCHVRGARMCESRRPAVDLACTDNVRDPLTWMTKR